LPTDTRHVLKFRRDPFTGVDGSDSKKATFAKQMPYRQRSINHSSIMISRRKLRYQTRVISGTDINTSAA